MQDGQPGGRAVLPGRPARFIRRIGPLRIPPVHRAHLLAPRTMSPRRVACRGPRVNALLLCYPHHPSASRICSPNGTTRQRAPVHANPTPRRSRHASCEETFGGWPHPSSRGAHPAPRVVSCPLSGEVRCSAISSTDSPWACCSQDLGACASSPSQDVASVRYGPEEVVFRVKNFNWSDV